MPEVDCHAHVFHRALPIAAGARYRPGYDVPLADHLAFLEARGIAHGVLVQPSFLGTDDGHLLDCLRASDGRLAGIAVVAADASAEALAGMAAAGVVGIRFNLIGREAEEVHDARARGLLERVSHLGWQVEVHVEGPRLPAILDALAAFDGPIVVDHFGRPDPARGRRCPGYLDLIARARDPRLFVKLSAPYRTPGLDPVATTGDLLAAFGPDRLLWGSDRPWTQHEASIDVDGLMPAAFGIDAAIAARLDAAATRLFGFAALRRSEGRP